MPPRTRRRVAQSRIPLVGAVVVALITGLLSLVAPTAAHAASGSIVDGGYIISDEDFFDSDSMTAAQIQTFLDGKVTTCTATTGPTCLKSYTADVAARAADQYCSAVPAKPAATAAEIIAIAGLACGISPKVILVMLQKEQGLVTSTAPTTTRYDKAMGQACPDTAACDPTQAGFVNQVYRGARQLQVYTQTPTRWNYQAGRENTILWHPDASCGTSKVYIQNQATANLYIYTPYRANVAALAAGAGTGDGCSTYGNRNFHNYFQSWFAGGSSTAALVGSCPLPKETEIVPASGYLTVTAASLNVRTAPTTTCSTGATQLGKGAVVQRTGTYGAWTRATVSGKTVWLSTFMRNSDNSKTPYLTAVLTPVPTIAGTAKAGQILTANPGAWLPAPAALSYQWKRGGAAIAGATASTYRVTNDDAGKALTVTVTGDVPVRGSVAQTSAPVTPTGLATARIEGDTRYETAAAVSRTAFPGGAKTVYLVSGTEFADALAASPLAATQGAALLLTAPKALPAAVATELKRLAPTRVVLVGGTTAIDSAMAGRITALLGSGVAVSRIGGADRYETSRLIAATWASSGTAYVATGIGYADALGAAAVAGAKKAPILLVKGDGQDAGAATIASLARLKPTSVVLVGGEAAIRPEIAAQFAAAKLSVTRYGGLDRYATNAALNSASYGSTVRSVIVATALDFPDALTGSLLAASSGAPIFVTRATCSTGQLGDFLSSRGAASATLIGGTVALSEDVARLKRC